MKQSCNQQFNAGSKRFASFFLLFLFFVALLVGVFHYHHDFIFHNDCPFCKAGFNLSQIDYSIDDDKIIEHCIIITLFEKTKAYSPPYSEHHYIRGPPA